MITAAKVILGLFCGSAVLGVIGGIGGLWVTSKAQKEFGDEVPSGMSAGKGTLIAGIVINTIIAGACIWGICVL